MNLHHEYHDLRGARNHADAEGYQRPAANTHDVIAAVPAVTVAAVVINVLNNAAD